MAYAKLKNWLRGLIGGAIGGGAGAALSALGVNGSAAAGMDIKPFDWKQLLGIFLAGSVVSIFMFLKQSPLPPPEDETNGGAIGPKLMGLGLGFGLLVSGVGCATPGPAGQARLTSLAQTAAYVGTVKRLQAHPEDRLKFELALQALNSLVEREQYDPILLVNIIQTLPALQSDVSGIYAESAVLLWDAALGDGTAIDKAPLVKLVALAVKSGIERGLARQ